MLLLYDMIGFVKIQLTVVFSGAEEQARNRFQSELEFVQCLANPNYLNCEWKFKEEYLIISSVVKLNKLRPDSNFLCVPL